MDNAKAWDFAIGLVQVDGIKPSDDFFMDKGFSYRRHMGFYYDRELTHDEWLKIAMELDDKGWFQNFHSFDTDVTGEIYSLMSVIKGTDSSENWERI